MVFFYPILYKILSYIMFSFCNSIIKYLIGGSYFMIENPVPIYIIVMYSYMFGAFFLFPYFYLKKYIFKFKIKYFLLHILRLVFFVSGFLLWGLSFKFMSIVQVVIISFGSYLLSIFGSSFFLKEKITLNRFICLFISIFGVFFTSLHLNNLYNEHVFDFVFLLPIFSSFMFSFEKLVSRKLILLKEDGVFLVFYIMFLTPFFCIIPVIKYGWFFPDVNHFFYFFVLGFCSILSIYFYNKAYVYSEVTFLMPFFPFKLILSCVFGYLFFGEILNFFNLFVWVFILIFCIILLYYEKRFDLLKIL